MRALTRFIGSRLVTVILLGAATGTVAGGVRAVLTIGENDYLANGMSHLAARTLGALVAGWTLWGAALALLAVVATLVLWPAGRLLMGGWQQGLTATAAAVPVLALLLLGGRYVNRHHLPGFFEPASIAANFGLVGFGFLLWLGLRTLGNRLAATGEPSGLRWFGGWVGLAVIVLGLALSQGARLVAKPAFDGPRINVLVLLVDALRPDRLGAYGYDRPTSPNIDGLSGQGTRFTQAVTTASYTKPSIATLFTSLYPIQHGIGTGAWGRSSGEGEVRGDVLHPALTTLAEVLANAGYHTTAIGHNKHLDAEFGFNQGFDSFQWNLRDERFITAPQIHRRFLDWLESHPDGFFGYLHYIDVHWPYMPPEPFAGIYAGPPPEVDYNRPHFIKETTEALLQGVPLDPDILAHMSDTYDEQIQYLDSKIGLLFDELKARGLYDRTLIVLTADHGEEFLEHGQIAHGKSLYDELLRVPLIVKLPCSGAECEPRVENQPAGLADVMPTILGRLGIPAGPDAQGRDLFLDPENEARTYSERGNRFAIRTLEYKYIYSFEEGTEELYDLQTDPGETNNLVAERTELSGQFRSELMVWIETAGRFRELDHRDSILDEETLKELRSLGYVQ